VWVFPHHEVIFPKNISLLCYAQNSCNYLVWSMSFCLFLYFVIAIALAEVTEPLVPADYYEVVLIPKGNFIMGCTDEHRNDCYDSERPTHKVTISNDFHMMKSEVTQGLYEKVMGSNPSYHSDCGSDCPVEKVSFYDAVVFANALSKMEGLQQCYSISGENVGWSTMNCSGWRLPTEAEWEYAARGGEKYKFAGSKTEDDVAWFRDNSSSQTHSVCSKKENGYGLCDMSGNVWEWCWDWKGSYSFGTQPDPIGPPTGSFRILRGGSWSAAWGDLRVALRLYGKPSDLYYGTGFRLVRKVQ
jgi:formylglycine-generating enzyme